MKNLNDEYIEYLKRDLDKNISKSLFERFRELIVSKKIPEGFTLPNENEMSMMLGVGRSTLREAYTALSVLGFIRRTKAGTKVNNINDIVNIAPFSITVENSDLNDLLEFRFMLEGEVASYAAKRATLEDIENIQKHYNNMIKFKDEINKFVNCDSLFHVAISDATHNKLLISTMKAASESFERDIRAVMIKSLVKNPQVISITIELHGEILKAIKQKDHHKAFSIMREHISYVNATVRYGN